MESAVHTFCRLRPVINYLPGHFQDNVEAVEPIDLIRSNNNTIEIGDRFTGTVDKVFNAYTSQLQLFDAVGLPLVDALLQRRNVSLLVFGQTASGKTHTCMGDSNDPGLLPRSLKYLFRSLHNIANTETSISSGKSHPRVTIACLEIYLERCCDLLAPCDVAQLPTFSISAASSPIPKLSVSLCSSASPVVSAVRFPPNLRLRERPDGSVFVENLQHRLVTNEAEAMSVLQLATDSRRTSATAMNSNSSRSHAVYIVSLTDSAGQTVQFCVADLAGSEKLKKTNATGQVLHEAKAINKSLSALANCIFALSSCTAAAHVPFRNSKLTFLLKQSMVGGGKTHLLVCCSTAECDRQETESTLRFATMAKQIRMITTPTIDAAGTALSYYFINATNACNLLGQHELDVPYFPSHNISMQYMHNLKNALNVESRARLQHLEAFVHQMKIDLRARDLYIESLLADARVRLPLSASVCHLDVGNPVTNSESTAVDESQELSKVIELEFVSVMLASPPVMPVPFTPSCKSVQPRGVGLFWSEESGQTSTETEICANYTATVTIPEQSHFAVSISPTFGAATSNEYQAITTSANPIHSMRGITRLSLESSLVSPTSSMSMSPSSSVLIYQKQSRHSLIWHQRQRHFTQPRIDSHGSFATVHTVTDNDQYDSSSSYDFNHVTPSQQISLPQPFRDQHDFASSNSGAVVSDLFSAASLRNSIDSVFLWHEVDALDESACPDVESSRFSDPKENIIGIGGAVSSLDVAEPDPSFGCSGSTNYLVLTPFKSKSLSTTAYLHDKIRLAHAQAVSDDTAADAVYRSLSECWSLTREEFDSLCELETPHSLRYSSDGTIGNTATAETLIFEHTTASDLGHDFDKLSFPDLPASYAHSIPQISNVHVERVDTASTATLLDVFSTSNQRAIVPNFVNNVAHPTSNSLHRSACLATERLCSPSLGTQLPRTPTVSGGADGLCSSDESVECVIPLLCDQLAFTSRQPHRTLSEHCNVDETVVNPLGPPGFTKSLSSTVSPRLYSPSLRATVNMSTSPVPNAGSRMVTTMLRDTPTTAAPQYNILNLVVAASSSENCVFSDSIVKLNMVQEDSVRLGTGSSQYALEVGHSFSNSIYHSQLSSSTNSVTPVESSMSCFPQKFIVSAVEDPWCKPESVLSSVSDYSSTLVDGESKGTQLVYSAPYLNGKSTNMVSVHDDPGILANGGCDGWMDTRSEISATTEISDDVEIDEQTTTELHASIIVALSPRGRRLLEQLLLDNDVEISACHGVELVPEHSANMEIFSYHNEGMLNSSALEVQRFETIVTTSDVIVDLAECHVFDSLNAINPACSSIIPTVESLEDEESEFEHRVRIYWDMVMLSMRVSSRSADAVLKSDIISCVIELDTGVGDANCDSRLETIVSAVLKNATTSSNQVLSTETKSLPVHDFTACISICSPNATTLVRVSTLSPLAQTNVILPIHISPPAKGHGSVSSWCIADVEAVNESGAETSNADLESVVPALLDFPQPTGQSLSSSSEDGQIFVQRNRHAPYSRPSRGATIQSPSHLPRARQRVFSSAASTATSTIENYKCRHQVESDQHQSDKTETVHSFPLLPTFNSALSEHTSQHRTDSFPVTPSFAIVPIDHPPTSTETSIYDSTSTCDSVGTMVATKTRGFWSRLLCGCVSDSSAVLLSQSKESACECSTMAARGAESRLSHRVPLQLCDTHEAARLFKSGVVHQGWLCRPRFGPFFTDYEWALLLSAPLRLVFYATQLHAQLRFEHPLKVIMLQAPSDFLVVCGDELLMGGDSAQVLFSVTQRCEGDCAGRELAEDGCSNKSQCNSATVSTIIMAAATLLEVQQWQHVLCSYGIAPRDVDTCK